MSTITAPKSIDLPHAIKSDKWRALLFIKGGASYLAKRVFGTEQDASSYITWLKRFVENGLAVGHHDFWLVDKEVNVCRLNEYSHAIPMPAR